MSLSLTQSFLKNFSTVLQKGLRSFHWSFLEISVMKHVYVLSQKPTHILPQKRYKETSVLFLIIWWVTLFNHLYSLVCSNGIYKWAMLNRAMNHYEPLWPAMTQNIYTTPTMTQSLVNEFKNSFFNFHLYNNLFRQIWSQNFKLLCLK